MIINLKIQTSKRCELVDITKKVIQAVRSSRVTEGMAVIYSPHTTAGITINENADPSVIHDVDMKLSKLVSHKDIDYRHGEGNSDSHIKSSLIGASETVIIEGGRPVLGTWQGIFFAEFDGPRLRNVFIKVISG